jgi:hypothetical protein
MSQRGPTILIGGDEPQTTTTSDPELLIEEARERQRRRQKRQSTVLWMAGIVLILGLGAYRIARSGNAAPAPNPRAAPAVAHQPLVIYEKVETLLATPHLPTSRRTGEIWFSTGAPSTYRELLTIPGAPPLEVGAAPGHDPKLGNEMLVYLYDAKANTMYSAGANLEPSAPPPSLQSAFRHFLAEPGARIAGTRLFEGYKVYIVSFKAGVPGDPASETVYFDTTSYQPLLFVLSTLALGMTVRVLDYRTLPSTPANLRLTSLAGTHPGARVGTAPQSIKKLYGEASDIGFFCGFPGCDLGPFR